MVDKRSVRYLAALLSTAAGFIALLWFCGWVVRLDLDVPLPAHSPAELAAAEKRRDNSVDPGSETVYEDWRDQWAAALAETPEQLRYERPNEPRPFKGEMFLA